MSSPSPLASPSAPAPSPSLPLVLRPQIYWPAVGPSYPNAGALGIVAMALAYFALGVAAGALIKRVPNGGRWLLALVLPGAVAAVAYLVWVIRTIR